MLTFSVEIGVELKMKIACKPGPTLLLNICPLCTVYCPSSTAHCPLSTVRCPLSTRLLYYKATQCTHSIYSCQSQFSEARTYWVRETLRHETFGMSEDIYDLENILTLVLIDSLHLDSRCDCCTRPAGLRTLGAGHQLWICRALLQHCSCGACHQHCPCSARHQLRGTSSCD